MALVCLFFHYLNNVECPPQLIIFKSCATNKITIPNLILQDLVEDNGEGTNIPSISTFSTSYGRTLVSTTFAIAILVCMHAH